MMSHAIADRYQLEAELARGAVGVVHSARDLVTGERVAVKILHAEAAADPEVATAFLDEAEVLAELDHPGIVRPRDLIVDGTFMAMVMDLVDGLDLRRVVMQHGPLSPRKAAATVAAVADALAAVHSAGIVHGDVKPGNILMPSDGGPARLVDFGVARRTAAPDAPTHGTPDYTAPEIVDGHASSAKSDVYGIGLVLFEALCGCSPYRGGSVDEVLQRHRSSIPVRPHDLPVELWSVVESCLSLNPADRPDAQALTPLLRATEPTLSEQPAAQLSPPVELRAREAVAMAPLPPPPPGAPILTVGGGLAAGEPRTSVAPPVAVPLPAGTMNRERRRVKPALLAAGAAGIVAVAAAGFLLTAGFGDGSSAADDPDSSSEAVAGEEDDSEKSGEGDQNEPESESTSPDPDDSDSDDDSNDDGQADDNPGGGGNGGESDTDVPGGDIIGSELPGTTGGN
ncbi:MAG: serine/threonine protein kinase [Stackebrandtia sp.]